MFIASVGDSKGEVPGLQSVATAIATLCLRSRSTGGFLLFLERVKSAGQQHRDRARRGHRLGPVLVEMFEMIGRQRAILRGERGALAVRQLLGVEADAKAVLRGGLEQALDLLRGEGDGVAISVDRRSPGRSWPRPGSACR